MALAYSLTLMAHWYLTHWAWFLQVPLLWQWIKVVCTLKPVAIISYDKGKMDCLLEYVVCRFKHDIMPQDCVHQCIPMCEPLHLGLLHASKYQCKFTGATFIWWVTDNNAFNVFVVIEHVYLFYVLVVHSMNFAVYLVLTSIMQRLY